MMILSRQRAYVLSQIRRASLSKLSHSVLQRLGAGVRSQTK